MPCTSECLTGAHHNDGEHCRCAQSPPSSPPPLRYSPTPTKTVTTPIQTATSSSSKSRATRGFIVPSPLLATTTSNRPPVDIPSKAAEFFGTIDSPTVGPGDYHHRHHQGLHSGNNVGSTAAAAPHHKKSQRPSAARLASLVNTSIGALCSTSTSSTTHTSTINRSHPQPSRTTPPPVAAEYGLEHEPLDSYLSVGNERGLPGIAAIRKGKKNIRMMAKRVASGVAVSAGMAVVETEIDVGRDFGVAEEEGGGEKWQRVVCVRGEEEEEDQVSQGCGVLSSEDYTKVRRHELSSLTTQVFDTPEVVHVPTKAASLLGTVEPTMVVPGPTSKDAEEINSKPVDRSLHRDHHEYHHHRQRHRRPRPHGNYRDYHRRDNEEEKVETVEGEESHSATSSAPRKISKPLQLSGLKDRSSEIFLPDPELGLAAFMGLSGVVPQNIPPCTPWLGKEGPGEKTANALDHHHHAPHFPLPMLTYAPSILTGENGYLYIATNTLIGLRWKRRYFQLLGSVLSCFRNSDSRLKALARFDLNEKCEVRASRQHRGRAYVLELKREPSDEDFMPRGMKSSFASGKVSQSGTLTDSGKWYMSASSCEHLQLWFLGLTATVQRITHAVSSRKRGERGPAPPPRANVETTGCAGSVQTRQVGSSPDHLTDTESSKPPVKSAMRSGCSCPSSGSSVTEHRHSVASNSSKVRSSVGDTPLLAPDGLKDPGSSTPPIRHSRSHRSSCEHSCSGPSPTAFVPPAPAHGPVPRLSQYQLPVSVVRSSTFRLDMERLRPGSPVRSSPGSGNALPDRVELDGGTGSAKGGFPLGHQGLSQAIGIPGAEVGGTSSHRLCEAVRACLYGEAGAWAETGSPTNPGRPLWLEVPESDDSAVGENFRTSAGPRSCCSTESFLTEKSAKALGSAADDDHDLSDDERPWSPLYKPKDRGVVSGHEEFRDSIDALLTDLVPSSLGPVSQPSRPAYEASPPRTAAPDGLVRAPMSPGARPIYPRPPSQHRPLFLVVLDDTESDAVGVR